MLLISTPLATSYALLPELDYLPPVKRDAVDAYFQFPPGISDRAIARDDTSRCWTSAWHPL